MYECINRLEWVNTLRPRQNGHHFTDDIFKCTFMNENVWLMIKISLKFVPKCPTNNIPALVQIMAWCQPGNKPLSEPMMVSLLLHIYVTRPQWVKEQHDVHILDHVHLHFELNSRNSEWERVKIISCLLTIFWYVSLVPTDQDTPIEWPIQHTIVMAHEIEFGWARESVMLGMRKHGNKSVGI